VATHIATVLDSDWALPLDEVAQRLRERWPAAQVTTEQALVDTSTRAVVAYMRTEAGSLEVRSELNGTAVFVEGNRRPMVEAIAWYRSIVPAGETVVLTDETGGYVWPLGPGVTADDVEDFLCTGK
jgi:hypothetical protein